MSTSLSTAGAATKRPCLTSASGVQVSLGASRAAAMDVNTACTSFLYGLATATAMIRTGIVRNAVVIGVELISPLHGLEQSQRRACSSATAPPRSSSQATDQGEGVLGERARMRRRGAPACACAALAAATPTRGVTLGDTLWDFDGQAIFKRAVKGMSDACGAVLAQAGVTGDQIDLVIPHQANLRIIEAVAQARGHPDGAGDRDGAELRQHERRHRAGEPRRGFEAGRVHGPVRCC